MNGGLVCPRCSSETFPRVMYSGGARTDQRLECYSCDWMGENIVVVDLMDGEDEIQRLKGRVKELEEGHLELQAKLVGLKKYGVEDPTITVPEYVYDAVMRHFVEEEREAGGKTDQEIMDDIIHRLYKPIDSEPLQADGKE